MASFFGITSAKYQYAIDEYYRMKKEVWFWTGKTDCVFMFTVWWELSVIRVHQREEENEENRLSEEAERTFNRSQGDDDEDEAITAGNQPDAAVPPADAAFQIENESPPPRSTFMVPAIVTAT